MKQEKVPLSPLCNSLAFFLLTPYYPSLLDAAKLTSSVETAPDDIYSLSRSKGTRALCRPIIVIDLYVLREL